MYLYKEDLLSKSISTKGHQDLSNYNNIFGFGRFLVQEKLEMCRRITSEQLDMLADFAAAQIACMFENQLLKREELIKQALRCCRDILQDMNYIKVDVGKIVSIIQHIDKIYVFSVGCQNEEMLECRVSSVEKICIELIHLRKKIDLIFSGKNPQKVKVKIPDESQLMYDFFEKKMERWPEKWNINPREFMQIKKISTENESGNTTQNVQKLLELEEKSFRDNIFSLFVVTSTFHLIRVAKEIEKQFIENGINNLKTIFLVGSESELEPNRVTMEIKYVKSMFFEILKYLMAKEEYWIS